MALVTGSYRCEIEPVLDNLGWRDFFPLIVTRDDVQHAKPHPEPYLTALERLNLSAAECLALEDSPTGIRSAHDAGLTVLAVTTVHTTLSADVGYSAIFIRCRKWESMSDNWFQRRLLKNDVTALSTLQNQSDITLKSCHSG